MGGICRGCFFAKKHPLHPPEKIVWVDCGGGDVSATDRRQNSCRQQLGTAKTPSAPRLESANKDQTPLFRQCKSNCTTGGQTDGTCLKDSILQSRRIISANFILPATKKISKSLVGTAISRPAGKMVTFRDYKKVSLHWDPSLSHGTEAVTAPSSEGAFHKSTLLTITIKKDGIFNHLPSIAESAVSVRLPQMRELACEARLREGTNAN